MFAGNKYYSSVSQWCGTVYSHVINADSGGAVERHNYHRTIDELDCTVLSADVWPNQLITEYNTIVITHRQSQQFKNIQLLVLTVVRMIILF